MSNYQDKSLHLIEQLKIKAYSRSETDFNGLPPGEHLVLNCRFMVFFGFKGTGWILQLPVDICTKRDLLSIHWEECEGTRTL